MAGKKPVKPIKPNGKQGQISEDFLTLLLDEVQAARAGIAALLTQGDRIMATVAEVQAQVVTLKQAVTDGLARIQAHEDAESTTDAALQAQVAALTQANADLQTEIDTLKANGTDTSGLDAIQTDLAGILTQIQKIDPAPAETPVPPAP